MNAILCLPLQSVARLVTALRDSEIPSSESVGCIADVECLATALDLLISTTQSF
jgi:hypothetical protein